MARGTWRGRPRTRGRGVPQRRAVLRDHAGHETLGWLTEWLAVTALTEGETKVRFSSLFPFIGKTRLIAPPKTWWPPANPGRLYTEAAKLIPLEVVRNGIVDESRWIVDGETGCLFHTGSGAPVKIVVRTAAAIDRLTGVADPHRIACLEFAPNAGWWGCFSVEDGEWEARVKSAFRLLADSGFGGERSRGWGRAAAPEFSDASSLLPTRASEEGAWWLLSVFSPAATDAVDWSRGEYAAAQRGGWTDSHAGVAPKKQVRVIEEGSVLFAASLRGRAVDVAPDGFPHPVYRAGFALAVPAPPEPVMRQQQAPAVEPKPEEVSIPAEFEAAIHHHEPKPEPCDEPKPEEVSIPAEFEAAIHHHEPKPEPCDELKPEEVSIPAEFEAAIHHHEPKPEPCDELKPEEVSIPAEFEAAIHHHKPKPEPCDELKPEEVSIPAEFEAAIHHHKPKPEPCDELKPEEVSIPAEFEAAIHHHEPKPEPCDELKPEEVSIPAEFEAAIHHHEPKPEPCDELKPEEVSIPAEFEAAIHHEPIEQPNDTPERESDFAVSPAPQPPEIPAETRPARSESSDVETDTQGSSKHEELL